MTVIHLGRPLLDGSSTTPFYALTRYEELRRVLRSPSEARIASVGGRRRIAVYPGMPARERSLFPYLTLLRAEIARFTPH